MRCVMQQSGASTKGLMRFTAKGDTYHPSGIQVQVSFDTGDYAEVIDVDGTVQYVRTTESSTTYVSVSANKYTMTCYISYNGFIMVVNGSGRNVNIEGYVAQIRFGTFETL